MDGSDDPINTIAEQQPLINDQAVRRSRRRRSSFALWCIYITELLERVAFYSLIGNLIFLLNRVGMNWTSANAATSILLTNGVSYVSSFLGGIVATYCLGKFATTTIAFLIYLVGYFLFPFLNQSSGQGTPRFIVDFSSRLSSFVCHNSSVEYLKSAIHQQLYVNASPYYSYTNTLEDNSDHSCTNQTVNVLPLQSEPCFSFITITLLFIGLGVGSIKANLVPLGVDQCYGNAERTRHFVNRFYWFTNAGAGIAYVGVIYVQQAVNTFYGLIIPFCCLILAACTFLAGRFCYAPLARVDAPTSRNFSIICYLLRRRSCCESRRHSSYSQDELRQSPRSVSYVDDSCWNAAKQSYGGKFFDDHVNDLQAVCQIAAIFLTLLPFWIVYSQMQTTFVIQGWHMQFFPSLNSDMCSINDAGDYICQLLQVPAAALNAFNILAVILLLPITNWVYRMCERCLHRRVTYVERITFGHLFACAAMCVAGGVEMARLAAFWGDAPLNASDPNATMKHRQAVVQMVGNTPYYAPEMLIFWQIPQYFLIGLAEVLATIATLEYACARAPMRLNAVVMGFYWLVDGIANFIGIGLLQGVRGWLLFDNDCSQGLGINCRLLCKSPTGLCVCHLDYYFFLLAGVVAFGLLWFYLTARWLDMDQRRRNLSFIDVARQNANGYYTNGGTVPHHTECEASIDVVYNRQASYRQMDAGSGVMSSTYGMNPDGTLGRDVPQSSHFESHYRAYE